MHSNRLRFLHTLAVLDPGQGKEPGSRVRRCGQIQVSEGQERKSARATLWPAYARSGLGCLPDTHSPTQLCPNGGLPGLACRRGQRGGPPTGGGACPAGPRGCVDRAVRGWEEEETPGCALGPGPPAPGLEGVFLACAWRDIVSACLCPVCVYAEAPAAARVCTFCVRSELSREMSYMVWPQAPPGLSGGSSRSEGVRTQG